ncbi:hypothetical protein K474DRAFT_1252973 [Panus rudis PR-1116 ss-1]|nr:hypothetical protein K474DRAFT_1252973 [Panus rudis PR-1116 ss-1]
MYVVCVLIHFLRKVSTILNFFHAYIEKHLQSNSDVLPHMRGVSHFGRLHMTQCGQRKARDHERLQCKALNKSCNHYVYRKQQCFKQSDVSNPLSSARNFQFGQEVLSGNFSSIPRNEKLGTKPLGYIREQDRRSDPGNLYDDPVNCTARGPR